MSKLIHSPERSDLFHAGRQFAKQYPVKREDEQLNDDIFLLDNESYIEKLNDLNNAKRSKEESTKAGNNQADEGNKKVETDGFRNFINSVSFNVYDSLNKTLLSSKSEKKEEEDNALRMALNFMAGIMDECTHLKNFDRPVDPQLSETQFFALSINFDIQSSD